jgi:hypothetical protein
MTPRGRPKHGAAGERLVAAVIAELAGDRLVPDVRETERLHLAADLVDRLAGIRRQLRREGLTVATASGTVKAHPLLAAERAISAEVARLLDGISLTVTPVRDAGKQRAAQARWRRESGKGGRG